MLTGQKYSQNESTATFCCPTDPNSPVLSLPAGLSRFPFPDTSVNLRLDAGYNLVPVMIALCDYRQALVHRAIENIAKGGHASDSARMMEESEQIDEIMLDTFDQLNQVLSKLR